MALYMIFLHASLIMFVSHVWSQPPVETRHAEPEKDTVVNFAPKKFSSRNPSSESKNDGSSSAEYRVLNTVLAQLEKIRSQEHGEGYAGIYEAVPSMREADLTFLPEYTESMPESERELRHLGGIHRHYPICSIERNVVSLSNEEYEYRPSHYEEIRCIKNEYDQPIAKDVCSSLKFSCVQWNKTIHLTRRRYSSGCWETHTRIIPAGCECMWPGHVLGDMRQLTSCILNMESKH